jgi:tetratricopeptide (TPR) repeat protein
VFRGTLVEDTLSGQVHLGFVAPGCGAKAPTAFSLLLLTKSGKLTGSVVAKAPCAKAVRSTLWTRVVEPTPAARTVALEEPPMPPDFMMYDAPEPAGGDPERAAMEEAFSLSQAGQHEQARRLFLEVTKRRPGRGEAYNGVGMTYALRNDWDSAIEWYKRGLENQPGFGDLYFNLACAYAQSSRTPLGLRYLKLAAVKGFAQPEMLDDPDLEPLRTAPEFDEIRRLMASVPGPK